MPPRAEKRRAELTGLPFTRERAAALVRLAAVGTCVQVALITGMTLWFWFSSGHHLGFLFLPVVMIPVQLVLFRWERQKYYDQVGRLTPKQRQPGGAAP